MQSMQLTMDFIPLAFSKALVLVGLDRTIIGDFTLQLIL